MQSPDLPFFRDLFAAENRGELKELGDCTIGLCFKPGIIAFGEWILCRKHAKKYFKLRRIWKGVEDAPIGED